MNMLYITNVYPTKRKNMSPVVKNTVQQYLKYYPMDSITVLFLEKQNFFKKIFRLRQDIKNNKIDIIHIHFGGLYSFIVLLLCISTNTKKIITFHGTDIHAKLHKYGSFYEKIKIKINKIASLLSFFLVDKIEFVSESLLYYIPKCCHILFKNKIEITTLGVDYNIFIPYDYNNAKTTLKLNDNINYVLFVNNNNSLVKREYYAKKIINLLGKKFKILRLENINYDELYLYFNASLFLLITSENEGSPNIVREALATNLPIVSTDVGDISKYVQNTNNSIIIDKNDEKKSAEIIKNKIHLFYHKENSREKFEKIISYKYTSKKLHIMYKKLLKGNKF